MKNHTKDKVTDFKERFTSAEKEIKSVWKNAKVIQLTKPSWAIDIQNKLVDLKDRYRKNILRIDE